MEISTPPSAWDNFVMSCLQWIWLWVRLPVSATVQDRAVDEEQGDHGSTAQQPLMQEQHGPGYDLEQEAKEMEQDWLVCIVEEAEKKDQPHLAGKNHAANVQTMHIKYQEFLGLQQEKERYRLLYEEAQKDNSRLAGENCVVKQAMQTKDQEVLCLQQEKQHYRLLYELEAQRTNHLHLVAGENNVVKQAAMQRKDQEFLRLQKYVQALQKDYDQRIDALNAKVEEHQKERRELLLKVERAEQVHAEQHVAKSGFFKDFAATPALLQNAADAVKDAITICASELLSRIKKNSLPINFVRMNLDSKGNPVLLIKISLQSFLCHALFKCFEDPFFGASGGLPLVFTDLPTNRKSDFLQAYKRCRDMDSTQLLKEEAAFFHFVGAKEAELRMQLKEHLLLQTEDVQKTENFITSELSSSANDISYYSKWLRLAKAVWVLHNLAFAFEPSGAEVFRVDQGSVFEEEFMVDVAEDDDESEGEIIKAEGERGLKEVRFMCIPGFVVRRIIIKSRVFCVKTSKKAHP